MVSPLTSESWTGTGRAFRSRWAANRRESGGSGGGFLVYPAPSGVGTILVAQDEQDGQHPSRLTPRRGQVELGEDRGDVLLHRPDRYHELVGNALVGAAGRDQLEHLALPRGQPLDRIVLSLLGEQCRDDDRVDR